MWGCGLGFLVLALWNTTNVAVVTSILIVAISLNSAIYLGFMTNNLDLSPNFCGTLMGITNSLSTVASIFAPLAVGWMVDDGAVSCLFKLYASLHGSVSNEISVKFFQHTQSEWKNVFLLSGGIMFGSNLIYLIFGSSKQQRWNSPRTPIVKHYGIRTYCT